MHCTFEGFNLLKAAMLIFKCIHLEILSCRVFTPNIAALLLQSRYPIREIHFVPLELLPAVQLDLLQPATASGSRQRPFPGVPNVGPKQRTGDSLSRASAGFVVGLRLHVMTSASRSSRRSCGKWQEVFNGWYSCWHI